MGVDAADLSKTGDVAGLVDDDEPKEVYGTVWEQRRRVDPFSFSSWVDRLNQETKFH